MPRPRLTAPLSRPLFRRLAASYAINELGDWMGIIALSVLVFDRTDSALATAALFLGTRFLPALFAPLLVAQAEKPPPRFAQGFIVPDGQPAKTTLVGRMCLQPSVLTDTGEWRLDDVLGPGFALLVRSPRAKEIVPKLKAQPWSDLDARIVVFGDEAIEAVVSAREVTTNPRLAAYSDHVLLLRPDRYVACCIPAADLDKGAEAVSRLIAASFA